MTSEMTKFQQDLLASVREMRSGKAARITKVKLPPIAEARAKTGLSQLDFARLLGVSPRTLQDWEQGRRQPTGAAKTLLRVAISHPEILLSLPWMIFPASGAAAIQVINDSRSSFDQTSAAYLWNMEVSATVRTKVMLRHCRILCNGNRRGFTEGSGLVTPNAPMSGAGVRSTEASVPLAG